MGKRGPAPKPTALKALTGSWRAKLNPNEPQPPKGFPSKPATLTDEESLIWDVCAEQLYQQGVLTMLDGIALEGLVRARAEEMRAENDIRRSGLLIRNGSQLIPNPLLGIRDRAAKRVRDYLAAFGMTPADRTRVVAVQSSQPVSVDPVTELLDA